MTARRRREPVVLRRTEYASGLRVVTEQMPGVRSLTLGVWVGVGSRDERPTVAGASHFLEHLLFKGTKLRSARDIAIAFDAVGGDVNAFSAKEHTCFHCRVLDKDLPMAVDHLCDMLLHSKIAAADVDGERTVILEEIGMRDDTPDDLIHDLFAETLWQGHPLGRPVLGTRETITAMSRDQVNRFYRSHYEPSNFVVAAAGSVDHDELCRLLEAGMPTGERLPADSAAERRLRSGGAAPASSGATLVTRKVTEQAHLCLGTSGLSRNHPDRFAFGVANVALGGGMSSRLFQEIREKRGLAYSVYSYHSMFAETGLFCIYAGTAPSKAHEVLALVRDQMGQVAAGLAEEELERAKGHMKGSLVLSMEESSGRMSRLGKSELTNGEILSVDEVLNRIDAVSAEDARRVAAEVFARPQTLTVVGPFKARDFKGTEA